VKPHLRLVLESWSPGCVQGPDMDAITPISDEAEKPSHAPYGKACMNCVKSKTRCAGGIDGEKCERFVFLGFENNLGKTISNHFTTCSNLPKIVWTCL
jgi:hypothetical protein